jgi:mono/diheme cytochrome c family protein
MAPQSVVFGGLALAVVLGARARVGTLVQQAPPAATARNNPLQGRRTAELAGAKLFARECAQCHGADGGGLEKAPPLKRADVQGAAPGALFWVLRNGSLNRGMPSFAHLPEAQRWQIVTYIKTLNQRP